MVLSILCHVVVNKGKTEIEYLDVWLQAQLPSSYAEDTSALQILVMSLISFEG